MKERNEKIMPTPMGDKQWEIKFESCAYGTSGLPGLDNWLPMKGKDRATPHKKVNDCDH